MAQPASSTRSDAATGCIKLLPPPPKRAPINLSMHIFNAEWLTAPLPPLPGPWGTGCPITTPFSPHTSPSVRNQPAALAQKPQKAAPDCQTLLPAPLFCPRPARPYYPYQAYTQHQGRLTAPPPPPPPHTHPTPHPTPPAGGGGCLVGRRCQAPHLQNKVAESSQQH
jgi:hypothetical protein